MRVGQMIKVGRGQVLDPASGRRVYALQENLHVLYLAVHYPVGFKLFSFISCISCGYQILSFGNYKRISSPNAKYNVFYCDLAEG